MNSRELQDLLRDILEESAECIDSDGAIESVTTFDDVGLLTNCKGLVIQTTGGDEFQLTIVRSG